MSNTRTPIDPDLWTDEDEPHLIGGKLPSGEIVFPMPMGEAAKDVERVPLSRQGRLWSWTSQGFLPKPPMTARKRNRMNFPGFCSAMLNCLAK